MQHFRLTHEASHLVLHRGDAISLGGDAVSFAERVFSWFAVFAPRHVWDEETGDALETIAAMERAGASRAQTRLKICSTIFWVLLNGLRYIIAGLTGRKSPHK